MMPELQVPIFLDEHGDVSAFQSVPNAERYIEAIDVNNHEYIGYDPQGHLLQLRMKKNAVSITSKE